MNFKVQGLNILVAFVFYSIKTGPVDGHPISGSGIRLSAKPLMTIRNFYAPQELKLFVNKSLNVKSRIPELEVCGLSQSDDVSKANSLNQFFGSVFTVNDGSLHPDPPTPVLPPLPINFTPEINFLCF